MFYDSNEVILLTKAEYAEYLRSPHWRQFRKSAEKHLPKVCPCGARRGLHLHHMTYERLGRERLEDVAWLCGDCHHALHREDPKGGLFDESRRVPWTKPTEPTPEQIKERNRAVLRRNKAVRKARKKTEDERYESERMKARKKKYGGYLAKRG